MKRPQATWLLPALLALCVTLTPAQNVSGTLFDDRNANGIQDAGEPPLAGVTVELFGQSDGLGALDIFLATDSSGTFAFSPGNGCYLLRPLDPAEWRPSVTRFDRMARIPFPGDPSYPVGEPRFGRLDHGIDHLRSGNLRYTAMGDSIATNFNFCELQNFFGSFEYSNRLRSRIQCAAPGAGVALDEAAIKGEHTDDLLVDETGELNNVFRVIDAQPELISISMIGNDLLDVDVDNPTQAQVNTAVAEVLDARENLQEVLSSMLTWIPEVDVTLNTLYDNLAFDCYGGTATSPFHQAWIPLINQILRDLAWGQARTVAINEVAAEFAVEDQNGLCTGFDDLICLASSDQIHPVQDGYDVIAEKVWEAAAGVNLGSRDALGRPSIGGADFGYLRRVRRIQPTVWEVRDGAVVNNPEAALSRGDGDAAASITLGGGSQEFRLSGFPDWYDEVQIVKVVAGVRYRTGGTFADQLYRIEASPTGVFRAPPGYDFTATNWNFYTPLVGAGGPNAPAVKPDYPDARLLVRPNVTAFRTVSATLTGNPVLAPGAGEYAWPALTHADLATTAVRVAAASVGSDPGSSPTVELDDAWLDLYGWEKARPAEVQNLHVDRLVDGTLEASFDTLDGAERYNLYTGRLDTLRLGDYDHGSGAPAGPDCDAPTQSSGSGLQIVVPPGAQAPDSVYFLVTAHVDDVESPAGRDGDGVEIDRSQSTCH